MSTTVTSVRKSQRVLERAEREAAVNLARATTDQSAEETTQSVKGVAKKRVAIRTKGAAQKVQGEQGPNVNDGSVGSTVMTAPLTSMSTESKAKAKVKITTRSSVKTTSPNKTRMGVSVKKAIADASSNTRAPKTRKKVPSRKASAKIITDATSTNTTKGIKKAKTETKVEAGTLVKVEEDLSAEVEDETTVDANATTLSSTDASSRNTRKKRTASAKRSVSERDGEGAVADASAPATKRARTNKEQKKEEVVHVPKTINKTDPCQVLPMEIWHMILERLPLSLVVRTSVLNNAWLIYARSYKAWSTVIENGKLGHIGRKYRSQMALVASKASYFTCDKCFSYSDGRGRSSYIPLPVKGEEDDDTTWYLCWECRSKYYKVHPEALQGKADRLSPEYEPTCRLAKTHAINAYALSSEDLGRLDCDYRRNPHYRNAAPMQLFMLKDLQRLALLVHAGWVGVKAATCNKTRSIRELAKARMERDKVKVTSRKMNNTQIAGVNENAITDTQAVTSTSDTSAQASPHANNDATVKVEGETDATQIQMHMNVVASTAPKSLVMEPSAH
ncbi:hypothetical protein BGZ94_003728 [Podila epigama]|nr:hypothetical protein BGZ94_003728 [Podila epigama]